MAKSENPRRTIQALDTTFGIVSRLDTHGPHGVTELAESLGVPKSTVHKHLRTLEEAGYVRREGGAYRLGFKFLKHGGTVRDKSRIYTFGRPKVEELGNVLDEMVILSIREGDRGVFLFRSNDRYNLKESLPLGARFHLHQNAAGKAMLAQLDDDSVRELLGDMELETSTDATITNIDDLVEELDTIRQQGYALNYGERDQEIQAVSAAILDEKTGNHGAISISVPSDSPTAKHLDGEYSEAVRQAASELSLQLKHS